MKGNRPKENDYQNDSINSEENEEITFKKVPKNNKVEYNNEDSDEANSHNSEYDRFKKDDQNNSKDKQLENSEENDYSQNEEDLNNISYLNESESDNEILAEKEFKDAYVNSEQEYTEENMEESDEESVTEETDESEEMVELDEFSEQLIEETIKLLNEEKERLKEINLEIIEIKISEREQEEQNNELREKIFQFNTKIDDIEKKIESLNKLEKQNNYKAFIEYDVFVIQKRLLDAINNGEITYQMVYKKEDLSEKKIENNIKKEKLKFDIKLACILFYIDNLKKKFNCYNLNEAEVLIKDLNYLKFQDLYNSNEEKERLRINSQVNLNSKIRSPQIINSNNDEIYKVCISYKNKTIIYQYKLIANKNMNFIQFKTEVMKELYIDTTEFKSFYLVFQGGYVPNEDMVLPFLDYLSKKNIPMNFTLELNNESIFKINMRQKEKQKENEKNENQSRKKKKKLLELQGNFYNSEIAHLEAELKMKRIDDEAEQFKKNQGDLFNKLSKLKQHYIKEKEKKVKEYRQRHEYILDPEDHYFNAKDLCSEIISLENEEKFKKEEIIRLDKQKKDNPIIITYYDVFKLRIKQAFLFYMYLIFLIFFMVFHRFSKFNENIQLNIYDYLENNFLKNPEMKYLFNRMFNGKVEKSLNSKIYLMRRKKDWIIYQNLIINHIFGISDDQKDYRKTYNKILLSSNSDHKSSVYGAHKYVQFNHKFAKIHNFQQANKNDSINDYKKRFLADFVENSNSLNINLTNNINDNNSSIINHSFRKNIKEKLKFLFDFVDDELTISDAEYLKIINNLIPNVTINQISMDLGDCLLISDIKERTIPINIYLNKLDGQSKFINFLSNEKINNKSFFNYNDSSNSVKILYKNINSTIDDLPMPGKLKIYKNNGFKVYYDLSEHDPNIYDQLNQNVLNKLHGYDELRFSNIDLSLKHNKFNVTIRVLINYELSNVGYAYSDLSIQVLDFDREKDEFSLKFIFYKIAVYGIYAHLILSIIINVHKIIKYRDFKISIFNKTPIIVDCLGLLLILLYEILFIKLRKDADHLSTNKGDKEYVDTSRFIRNLMHIRIAKAVLTFMLTIRLFTKLKQSILITFLIRIFKGFYKTISNIYLLSITVILSTSIYLYVRSNNIYVPSFFESITMTRNIMYDAIDNRIFMNTSKNVMLALFIFLIICKSFVFSLFIAGIKTAVDDEITIYNNYIKNIKKNLIGDYLLFLSKFILKVLSGYILYEYKYLKELDQEILRKVKIGLNSFGGNDVKMYDDTNLKDLNKKQIETFYRFFEHKTELLLLSANYITELNDKFYMEKIELPNRDVYLIVELTKKKKEKIKEKKHKQSVLFNY